MRTGRLSLVVLAVLGLPAPGFAEALLLGDFRQVVARVRATDYDGAGVFVDNVADAFQYFGDYVTTTFSPSDSVLATAGSASASGSISQLSTVPPITGSFFGGSGAIDLTLNATDTDQAEAAEFYSLYHVSFEIGLPEGPQDYAWNVAFNASHLGTADVFGRARLGFSDSNGEVNLILPYTEFFLSSGTQNFAAIGTLAAGFGYALDVGVYAVGRAGESLEAPATTTANAGFTFDLTLSDPPTPVPEPSSMVLFATALVGLLAARKPSLT
jgi:hypothetical protein